MKKSQHKFLQKQKKSQKISWFVKLQTKQCKKQFFVVCKHVLTPTRYAVCWHNNKKCLKDQHTTHKKGRNVRQSIFGWRVIAKKCCHDTSIFYMRHGRNHKFTRTNYKRARRHENFGCITHRLIDWLIDWFTDRSIDRLIDWLTAVLPFFASLLWLLLSPMVLLLSRRNFPKPDAKYRIVELCIHPKKHKFPTYR